jgi:hypothetical protein
MMIVARLSLAAGLLLVFLASWVVAYTDAEGPLGGLSVDHFFYLARGWRLLAGELPDRDFVDPGAPLTFLVSAAAQLLLGRGAWSEVVVSATGLALGITLTCWLAVRVSGSLWAGLFCGVLPLALNPRLFSYPGVLVYSLAIWGLLSYAERPHWRRHAYLALGTTAGFLFRHDIGLLVGLATLTMFACLPGRSGERRNQALRYAALVLVLMAPYLVFLQLNGGIAAHFATAYEWARGEMATTPPTWPSPGVEGAATYYLLQAVPFLAVLTVALCAAARSVTPAESRAILISVSVLAIVLNITALRPLPDRLADASVPHAILLAWMIVAWARIGRGIRASDVADAVPVRTRALAGAASLVTVCITAVVLARALEPQARQLRLLDAPAKSRDVIRDRTYRLMSTWPLEAWSQRLESGPMRIAFYLRDCTLPTQAVFIADYLPHITALAERRFAGGHPDLRPGFFMSRRGQELTIARLEQEQVALVMAPVDEHAQAFRESFPLLDAYFAARYERLLTRVRDRGITVDLLIRKDPTAAGWNLMATGWYEPMRWPCFRHWGSPLADD